MHKYAVFLGLALAVLALLMAVQQAAREQDPVTADEPAEQRVSVREFEGRSTRDVTYIKRDGRWQIENERVRSVPFYRDGRLIGPFKLAWYHWLGYGLCLVGWASLVGVAIQRSIIWGLVVLFVPLGLTIFVIIHWREAKTWFMIWLAGVAVLVAGPRFVDHSAGSSTSYMPAGTVKSWVEDVR